MPDVSLRSARDAAREGRLAEWVATFLASPGSDNAELGEQLSQELVHWLGPVELPLNQLNRLAGPPGEPVLCPVDEDEWRDDVDDMREQIAEGWEPPPLVVSYRDGQLVLEDGNHRAESLRRAGRSEGWSVVGFSTAEERDRFERGDVTPTADGG
jgi:hypothetical protein